MNTLDTKCKEIKFVGKSETILDILVHIIILSAVLQIVFEVFLQKTEQKTVTKELKNTIQKVFTPLADKVKIPDKVLQGLDVWFQNDTNFTDINTQVKNRNRIVIIALIVMTMGFYISLKNKCKLEDSSTVLNTVLINNGLLLLIVGVIEVLFVTKIMLNYVPTKPSLMSQTVMKRIENFRPSVANKSKRNCWLQDCNGNLPAIEILSGYLVGFILLIVLTYQYKPTVFTTTPALIFWQGAIVSAVVSGLFLTLGVQQEKLIMENSINTIVDAYLLKTYQSIDTVAGGSADTALLKELGSLNAPDMSADDKRVEEKNSTLRVYALAICGTSFAVACGVTLIQYYVYKQSFLKKEYKMETAKNMLIGSLIAGVCSFMAEFNFMVSVAAPSRPISTVSIGDIIIKIFEKSS